LRKVDAKETPKAREERVLQKWNANKTFEKSVVQNQNKPAYVFYEGPPTANGSPHIGHVFGRVMKDFIARYKTMTGFQVVRKAGWDTHGLPVELGVEKKLGLSGKKEVEAYGVEKFITECKNSVFGYEKEWRELTEAIGYWVDMDRPYVTMDNSYIESVWNVLSQIQKKGYLYKGHRVSPYCPCCQTTLSSHEVAQGYEMVKDLSATVKFKVRGEDYYFLAWTTTPWTLPANAALCINPNLMYAKVKFEGDVCVVAETLVEKNFGDKGEIISLHAGSEFLGKNYEPPFHYFTLENAHLVISGDFVSDKSGTGIVHIAPGYGEEDYKVAKANGISFVHVADSGGKFKAEVKPLAGRFVKDCDVDIIKELSQLGLLFSKVKYEHQYPFCWRCKSPLLYYATDSWFIQTTAVKAELKKNNQLVEWFPSHIRDGRFGNFLDELVDWNISRNRYWGTPLNVWTCNCGELFCPSSIAELRERSLEKFDTIELHKPYVDKVKIACSCGGVMSRTPEVVDVWFDSGSMPFAQYHVPFENGELFKTQFPADMICEGVDQTRGWFYSLLAISTLLTGELPYKRVMALGHVLDDQGQKMSKTKGNVVDPWVIINEFGADAFRWALLSDSAPWNPKKFSQSIVSEAKSKVIDTLHNVHSFYTLYASIDGFSPAEHDWRFSDSVMDRWILSRLYTTVSEMAPFLEQYDFVKPAQMIEKFVDELSNWYVRRCRDRFWANGLTEDKIAAYQTLCHVLKVASQLIAPYAPFLAEDIFQNLTSEDSVHLSPYPQVRNECIDATLEEEMENVRQVVELARSVRNEQNLKTKQPLSKMYVYSSSQVSFGAMEAVIKDELNIKEIVLVESDRSFTDISLKLNLKVGGPKYGKLVGNVQRYLQGLSELETDNLLQQTSFVVEGTEIAVEDILIYKEAKKGYASAANASFSVTLDLTLTKELVQEGWVREIVRLVQEQRKLKGYSIEDYVKIRFVADEETKDALAFFHDLLSGSLLATSISFSDEEVAEPLTFSDKTIGIFLSQ
jgi:isoleucyl-tRNA synthetase